MVSWRQLKSSMQPVTTALQDVKRSMQRPAATMRVRTRTRHPPQDALHRVQRPQQDADANAAPFKGSSASARAGTSPWPSGRCSRLSRPCSAHRGHFRSTSEHCRRFSEHCRHFSEPCHLPNAARHRPERPAHRSNGARHDPNGPAHSQTPLASARPRRPHPAPAPRRPVRRTPHVPCAFSTALANPRNARPCTVFTPVRSTTARAVSAVIPPPAVMPIRSPARCTSR